MSCWGTLGLGTDVAIHLIYACVCVGHPLNGLLVVHPRNCWLLLLMIIADVGDNLLDVVHLVVTQVIGAAQQGCFAIC